MKLLFITDCHLYPQVLFDITIPYKYSRRWTFETGYFNRLNNFIVTSEYLLLILVVAIDAQNLVLKENKQL